jgi:hypothetical protein
LIDDGLDLRTQAFNRRGRKSLVEKFAQPGVLRRVHENQPQAQHARQFAELGLAAERQRTSNICCARFAESLGSLAIEEHSAWLKIDHTAHLPPTST